jgi:ubiquinone/menaquinone biosynthesis C-methylase UbiE
MRKNLVRSALFRVWKFIGRTQNFEEMPQEVPAEPTGKFTPDIDEWVHSHFYNVVDETSHFCGDIFSHANVLNVGCGEMLTDFGFLRMNPASITGLDISPRPDDHLEQVASKLSRFGIEYDQTYNEKIRFLPYDGENIPLQDSMFDVVFSWSAFEHVGNVPRVISEIYRVLKPNGKAFIQVYPWYSHFHGSHLTDWISEPFFHLTRPNEWVFDRLTEAADADPHDREFLMDMKWPDYLSLNRISVRKFYQHVLEAGFTVEKARLISHDQDLSKAPPEADLADLMIGGTMMLLSK